MNTDTVIAAFAEIVATTPRSTLLIAALAALVVGWVGSMMIRQRIPLGGLVRGLSTLALVGVLSTVVLQFARFDPRFDVAMADMGLPEQVVEGRETRVPLSPDGHYWLRASVNGTEARFMVDTGATLTTISTATAQRAGVLPREGHPPIQLNTANGTIEAPLAVIDELRFGNVAARGLDTVIAPNIGDMNVIGMNLLSRLAEWKVQQGVLVLVPNNPQPETTFAE
ncbi:TIGR02281 family clan AA aspartic protease [Parerythrobacter aurantius]|uniref:retropepsin-like aspartic protease family protein n=1 Tax=Parerythrobacter aurantius TaxID=3127706 RepID=UPI00325279E6